MSDPTPQEDIATRLRAAYREPQNYSWEDRRAMNEEAAAEIERLRGLVEASREYDQQLATWAPVLRDWAAEIEADGTPSQIGPSSDELLAIASALPAPPSEKGSR